jgi:type 1 glutamine amidotransferase
VTFGRKRKASCGEPAWFDMSPGSRIPDRGSRGPGLRFLGTLAVLILAFACSSGGAATEPAPVTQPIGPGRSSARVLMLTATAAFRHDSIPAARQVMTRLAVTTGQFAVTPTEDLSLITADTLRGYDVVMFALTSGELPFSASQKNALIDFVSSGHGFVGVHSATDTLYEWPDYGRLVGASFKEHPWTQRGTVALEDPSHPANAGVTDRLSITEEFYTFQENPRPHVAVLLHLDPVSVGAAGGDYPLAWAQSFGTGRSYYNALGHFPETWNDDRFQRMLASAIVWASGR